MHQIKDGMAVKGEEQRGSAFVWTAEGVDYKGNAISRKGVVTIIR